MLEDSYKKENYPLVSCLGSVYINSNLDELRGAINSIINQNYKFIFEIIIVFDGPVSNEIEEFFKSYKKLNNKELKIYRLKENKGLGGALNFGLTKCRGSLIARFDTDDINHPDRLANQVSFMSNNSDISVLCTSAYEFKSDKFSRNIICKVRRACPSKYIRLLMSLKNPINHPTVMFRRQDILKLDGYPEKIKFFEDYFLWLKLRKNNFKFASLDKNLVYVRTDGLYSRRYSLAYLKKEIFFIKNVFFKFSYISFIFLPIFALRLFLRLIPLEFFQKLLRHRKGKEKVKNPDLIFIHK